jgi:hypothetical protein
MKPNIPLAGGTFSFLGTGAGTFFSGMIFLGGSGTLERLKNISLCYIENDIFEGLQSLFEKIKHRYRHY